MVRRAVIWTFSAQFASFFIGFVGSIAVARLLSPREMGIYAVAAATIGLLQLVSTFGVGAYVIREVELSQKTLDTAFTINTILAILLALIIAGASYPTAIFLRESAVASVLQMLALTPLLSIPEFRPATVLQREMKFGALSLIGVTRLAISIVVTVASAAMGASYMSPAYGTVASAIFGTIAFVAVAPHHVNFRTSLAQWRPIAKFGFQIMSVSGVSVAAARISDLVLGRLLGLTTLGLYSRASNLSNMIFSNLYGTGTRVVYAQLAKDFRERGVVRDTFLLGLRMIAGFMGPVLIGIAVLARPLIAGLYGEKWLGAAPVLSLLMVAQFISLTFAMNWELFAVRDRLGLQVKYEVSRSIFGVAAQTIGCLFGIIGAAASNVVTAFFSIALYVPIMPRLADSNHRELARIYLEAFSLTVVACLPATVLMHMNDWSAGTSVIQIVAAVLLGGCGWFLLLFTRSHPLAMEIRHFTRLIVAKLSTKTAGSS
jgi:O-antigen/teichoic acid export membrane protein